MTQWLIIYGPVEHPHIYATAYAEPEVKAKIAECCARHGNRERVRAIDAQRLPPSRVKS